MNKPIHAYIIEDEELLANSICELLPIISRGDVVCDGYATSGEEGVENVLRKRPDVVLIDLDLGNGKINGFGVGKRIKKEFPDCKLIAVTKTRSFQPVSKALKLGFNGYFLKDEKLEFVVTAIKDALKGKILLTQSIARYLPDNSKYDRIKNLTDRELQVLKMFSTGVSNKEISEKLSISSDTAKHHVSEILQKLDFNNRGQLTAFVTELQQSGLLSLLIDEE